MARDYGHIRLIASNKFAHRDKESKNDVLNPDTSKSFKQAATTKTQTISRKQMRWDPEPIIYLFD